MATCIRPSKWSQPDPFNGGGDLLVKAWLRSSYIKLDGCRLGTNHHLHVSPNWIWHSGPVVTNSGCLELPHVSVVPWSLILRRIHQQTIIAQSQWQDFRNLRRIWCEGQGVGFQGLRCDCEKWKTKVIGLRPQNLANRELEIRVCVFQSKKWRFSSDGGLAETACSDLWSYSREGLDQCLVWLMCCGVPDTRVGETGGGVSTRVRSLWERFPLLAVLHRRGTAGIKPLPWSEFEEIWVGLSPVK